MRTLQVKPDPEFCDLHFKNPYTVLMYVYSTFRKLGLPIPIAKHIMEYLEKITYVECFKAQRKYPHDIVEHRLVASWRKSNAEMQKLAIMKKGLKALSGLLKAITIVLEEKNKSG